MTTEKQVWYVVAVDSLEVQGLGESAAEAMRDYAERWFVPSDLGVEDWDAIDFDRDAEDVFGGENDTAVCTHERYLEMVESKIVGAR